MAGVAFLLGWGVTLLLRDRTWVGTQWGTLAVDIAFLLVVGWIALQSRFYWPIWATGFQLLGVVTHVARMLDRTVGAWAYVTAGIIWTQLVLIALGVGVFNRWRERRQPAASGAPAPAPGATRL